MASKKTRREIMIKNLPDDLGTDLARFAIESQAAGIRVRRVATIQAALTLLLILIFSVELPGNYVVAITIAASAIWIIRAIYSMSASLNMQCDTITRIIVHYSEPDKQ
jgi:hypothetical protein